MRPIALSIVILSSTLMTGCGWTSVTGGNLGIKLVWGEIQEQPLVEGLHIYNFISTKVEQMSTRVQKAEVTATASSKDLQVVTSKLAVNFRLDGKHAVTIYRDIGNLDAVISTIIDPAIQESLKKSTAQFTAAELITQRAQAKQAINEDLTATLVKNNITVTEVSITDFKFDENYQHAVEAKQIAQQRAQQATNDLERIKVEAHQKEAKAAGEANAMLVKAEAEAKAQELLRKTLTSEIVQLRAIEKWNGEQPMVVGNDGALFDLSALRKARKK